MHLVNSIKVFLGFSMRIVGCASRLYLEYKWMVFNKLDYKLAWDYIFGLLGESLYDVCILIRYDGLSDGIYHWSINLSGLYIIHGITNWDSDFCNKGSSG